ncbi:MAG: hypothetical protein IT210_05890 [Armatimonadetes bacterium]|nr:hypothetical protein [Armatimonadota bacterium]
MNRDELQELLRDLQKGFRTRDEICDLLEKQIPGSRQARPARWSAWAMLWQAARDRLTELYPARTLAVATVCVAAILLSAFRIAYISRSHSSPKPAPTRRASVPSSSAAPVNPVQRPPILYSIPIGSQPSVLEGRRNPFAPLGPVTKNAASQAVLPPLSPALLPVLWGKKNAKAAPPAPDGLQMTGSPDVRLVAILDTDSGTGAVIEDAAGTRVVQSGAALDNGWRVARIGSDRITIAHPAGRMDIRCGEGRSRPEASIPSVPIGPEIRRLKPNLPPAESPAAALPAVLPPAAVSPPVKPVQEPDKPVENKAPEATDASGQPKPQNFPPAPPELPGKTESAQ